MDNCEMFMTFDSCVFLSLKGHSSVLFVIQIPEDSLFKYFPSFMTVCSGRSYLVPVTLS